jgi:hypothetical protein
MEVSAWKWLTQLYVGTGIGQGCGAKGDSGWDRGQVGDEMSDNLIIRIICIVTILAKGRGRLVEDHVFAFHFARQFVTVQAGHVTVRAIEGISCPLVMVKLGWFPTHGVMAT